MSSPLVQAFLTYAIARAVSAGDDPDYGRLQGMISDIIVSNNRMVERLSGITNADGTLKNFPVTGALSLNAVNRIVATAGQTSFVVSSYGNTTDTVVAYSGSALIDTNSVTKTNSTHVTLPAQTVNTVVTIFVYTTGVALLSRLANTITGEGAALIGVQDNAANYVAANVEACLAEVMARLIDLETAVGNTAGLIRADGTVTMQAPLNINGSKLTNVANGTDPGDAVNLSQITGAALIAIVSPVLATFFLALAGGTMTGALNMAGQRIKNLPMSTDPSDAISRVEAQAIVTTSVPVGTILEMAYAAADTGFVLCDGSTYDGTNDTYAALFAKIGLNYGGSGTNFMVPDKRGRVGIGSGTGTSLSARTLGASGGEERHTLTTSEMPAHTHPLVTNNDDTAATGGPRRNKSGSGTSSVTTSSTGGGNSHNNMQPYLVCNYQIKL